MKFFKYNFFKTFITPILLLSLLTISNSCGIYKPVSARDIPPEVDKRVKKNIEEGRGIGGMGGILGNLADRVFRESVVDFVRVYIERRGGAISEWPAFNVADAAICAGVGFLFYIAWTEGSEEEEATQ